MKTSVVTVTYNKALQLERGLKTILSQEVLPDEIIVVDDGSTDNTGDVLISLYDLFKEKNVILRTIYLNHPEPRISCIPRNIGWKEATGDLIIFTEPECLHVDNTIAQLIEKVNESPDMSHLASQVWTIQEKIYKRLTEDNFRRPATILNHEYAQLTDNANMSNTKAPDSDWAITGQKNCAAGCLFAVKKEWLEAVGGFDESFEGHGFDDFDLFNRLAVYGAGVVKHDDIIVIHQWHEKNYPYNIYDMAERNGRISEDNIKKGIFKVNT